MSRKQGAIFMGLGILAGLTLSGPAVQAADYLTARPSSQPIYVDGLRVSMTAYNIGGNNYVRLRDIGCRHQLRLHRQHTALPGGDPRHAVRPHGRKRPGHPGAAPGNLPQWGVVPHTLPFHQRRAI